MINLCVTTVGFTGQATYSLSSTTTSQDVLFKFGIVVGAQGCSSNMATHVAGILIDATVYESDAQGVSIPGGYAQTYTGLTGDPVTGELSSPFTLPFNNVNVYYSVSLVLASIGSNTCPHWTNQFAPPVGCTDLNEHLFMLRPSSVPGCTDASALNYDCASSTNPGSTTPCTDNVTVDDGSCVYPLSGCTDSSALNYNPAATTDDGSCTYPVSGCTDSSAHNYNSLATIDDGSCIYCVWGCMNQSSINYNPLATCDNGSCIPCVYGCMNPSSSNYNPLATCDDGSCTGCVYGCTDSTASNYNSSATCDDGSCCIDGCTDSTALNYNVLATCDDGGCLYCVDGCTDSNSSNYDAAATCDDGSCLESECSDCFQLLNVLYKEANCEGCNEDDYLIEKRNLQRFTNLRIMRDMAYECGDTAYVATMQAEEYEMCSTLLDEHTNEGVNDYKVYGCTNPASANYNPKATHPCTRQGVVNFCCGNSSTLKISGCIDPLATNYNPAANIDDGNCLY